MPAEAGKGQPVFNRETAALILNDAVCESALFTNIFYRFFVETASLSKRVCLYPANGFAKGYYDFCRNNRLPLPVIIDDNPNGDNRVTDAKKTLKGNFAVCIVSLKYEDVLYERAVELHPEHTIKRYGNLICGERTGAYSLKNLMTSASVWGQSSNMLFIAERLQAEAVLIVGRNQFSDTAGKVSVFRKATGCRVLAVDTTALCPYEEEGIIYAQESDIFAYVIKERRGRKLIFYIPTFYKNYCLAAYIYKYISKNVFIYIYDRLQKMSLNSNSRVFNEQYRTDMQLMVNEHIFSRAMLAEGKKMVTGIICRDEDNEIFPNCKTPYIFFPASLHSSLFQKNSHTESNNSIVNIGVVMHRSIDKAELNAQCFMENIFADTIAAGFSITLYVSDNYRDRAVLYQQQLKRGIQVRQGKKLPVLLPEIADKYTWGLCAANDALSSENSLRKVGIPAKFHTYIALGIPVIVSDSVEAVADIVRKHRLGVVVGNSDFIRLGEIIKALDYKGLVANIERYRSECSFDSISKRLYDFLEDNIEE